MPEETKDGTYYTEKDNLPDGFYHTTKGVEYIGHPFNEDQLIVLRKIMREEIAEAMKQLLEHSYEYNVLAGVWVRRLSTKEREASGYPSEYTYKQDDIE